MSTVAEQGRQTARTAPRGTLFVLVSHTVRMQLRSVLIWGAALGLYSAAMVASFTTIEGSAEQLNRLMEAYPKGMLEAFGVTDLGDLANYLHSQFFGLAPLALSFFPILALANANCGSRRARHHRRPARQPPPALATRRRQLPRHRPLATRDQRPRRPPHLGHCRPGRRKPLTARDHGRRTQPMDGVLNLWPITVVFGALALLCSALFHRRAFAISIPAFLLFGMYLIDAIGRASEDLEDWRPASAFYYYGSAIANGIDWTHFVSMTLIALALALLAALAFRRRDIYT
jgi:ABC-2 type transport system permease protein